MTNNIRPEIAARIAQLNQNPANYNTDRLQAIAEKNAERARGGMLFALKHATDKNDEQQRAFFTYWEERYRQAEHALENDPQSVVKYLQEAEFARLTRETAAK